MTIWTIPRDIEFVIFIVGKIIRITTVISRSLARCNSSFPLTSWKWSIASDFSMIFKLSRINSEFFAIIGKTAKMTCDAFGYNNMITIVDGFIGAIHSDFNFCSSNIFAQPLSIRWEDTEFFEGICWNCIFIWVFPHWFVSHSKLAICNFEAKFKNFNEPYDLYSYNNSLLNVT